jgi:hypothetical protein
MGLGVVATRELIDQSLDEGYRTKQHYTPLTSRYTDL